MNAKEAADKISDVFNQIETYSDGIELHTINGEVQIFQWGTDEKLHAIGYVVQGEEGWGFQTEEERRNNER